MRRQLSLKICTFEVKTFPFLYVSLRLWTLFWRRLWLSWAGMNWCGGWGWDWDVHRTTNKSTVILCATHFWCTCCDCCVLFHLKVFRVPGRHTEKVNYLLHLCDSAHYSPRYILLKRFASNLWGIPFRYLYFVRRLAFLVSIFGENRIDLRLWSVTRRVARRLSVFFIHFFTNSHKRVGKCDAAFSYTPTDYLDCHRPWQCTIIK